MFIIQKRLAYQTICLSILQRQTDRWSGRQTDREINMWNCLKFLILYNCFWFLVCGPKPDPDRSPRPHPVPFSQPQTGSVPLFTPTLAENVGVNGVAGPKPDPDRSPQASPSPFLPTPNRLCSPVYSHPFCSGGFWRWALWQWKALQGPQRGAYIVVMEKPTSVYQCRLGVIGLHKPP